MQKLAFPRADSAAASIATDRGRIVLGREHAQAAAVDYGVLLSEWGGRNRPGPRPADQILWHDGLGCQPPIPWAKPAPTNLANPCSSVALNEIYI
jgi:hypothetical protein